MLLTPIESTDLDKCDLYPVVGLDVKHLDPVSCDRKSAVIFGDAPRDVDLVSDAVLVLRSAPDMRDICIGNFPLVGGHTLWRAALQVCLETEEHLEIASASFCISL